MSQAEGTCSKSVVMCALVAELKLGLGMKTLFCGAVEWLCGTSAVLFYPIFGSLFAVLLLYTFGIVHVLGGKR